MSDPVEPPEVVFAEALRHRAETAEAEHYQLLERLDALSARLKAAEAERDRLRRALQRIVDWTDLKPTNVRRGGVRDFVREVLSTSPATTSPDTEELNP